MLLTLPNVSGEPLDCDARLWVTHSPMYDEKLYGPQTCTEPELQECMDTNEGSAAMSAHGREPQITPERLKAQDRGKIAHQSAVNKRRREESRRLRKRPPLRFTRESMAAVFGTPIPHRPRS